MQDVRKNFNVFLDGKGYAGKVEEFNAPKMTLKTEEFRGGGMHAPVDITMGHERLDADFTLISYDRAALTAWGVVEGKQVQFTAREALESGDGTVTAVVHTMRGKVKEIDAGTSKAGDKASLKISLNLSYYRLTHGAVVVQEIDIPNMVARNGGVDALAAVRNAIGI